MISLQKQIYIDILPLVIAMDKASIRDCPTVPPNSYWDIMIDYYKSIEADKKIKKPWYKKTFAW